MTDLRTFVFEPTGPISVKGSIVVWVNGTGRISIDVSMERIVSVSRSMNTFSSCAWVIVDGFVEWPRGRNFWDVAQWTKDSSARMDGVRGPYVIRS